MARAYAAVQLGIWSDDDWRKVSFEARYLYLTLLTSPTLSYCGVADWRPVRIAALIGMTPDQVARCGTELSHAMYVVIDEASEEVLIRSYLRHDDLMKQPNLATAMAKAHYAVVSTLLRGVVVHELQRLREDKPELRGWNSGEASSLLDLRSVDPASINPPEEEAVESQAGTSQSPSRGSRKGEPNPSNEGLRKGELNPPDTGSYGGKSDPSSDASSEGSRTPSPTPASITLAPAALFADSGSGNEGAAPPLSNRRRKPSVPLPPDWTPTKAHHARCLEQGLDPARELEKFRLHAEANDRRQVSWNASFGQWLLNARPASGARLFSLAEAQPDGDGHMTLPPLPKGLFER